MLSSSLQAFRKIHLINYALEFYSGSCDDSIDSDKRIFLNDMKLDFGCLAICIE